MNIMQDTKQKMDQAIEHYRKELRNLRTGRANPSMLDDIKVEVYGSEMNLKSVATVSASEGRQLVITPFDPSTVAAICKSIESSPLGLRATPEGHIIRVPIPPLSQEVREQIVKHGRKKAEESKIQIREIRRKANAAIKASDDITDDEKKRLEKQVQEATDKHCKDIDTLFEAKEKDILEV